MKQITIYDFISDIDPLLEYVGSKISVDYNKEIIWEVVEVFKQKKYYKILLRRKLLNSDTIYVFDEERYSKDGYFYMVYPLNFINLTEANNHIETFLISKEI